MMKSKRIECFKVIVGCLFFLSLNLWAEKREHESDEIKPQGRKVEPRGPKSAGDVCNIFPGDISRFANGEGYNFKSVVQLVTNPECAKISNSIVAQEISQGVKFNQSPFRLDEFAKGYSNLTIEGKRSIDTGIQKNVLSNLRNASLSNRELLPVLGQLSLLSPKSARSMLAYLITQELISQELEGKRGLVESSDLSIAIDTLSTLQKFGANEPLIIEQLANNIEEMAASSQADSLGKVLTGLALAAREIEELAPTFNSSATAFKKGVDKSAAYYTEEERGNLLKAGFSAANASVGYSPLIESGSQEINEALSLLFGGKPLAETTLKSLWRKVVEVASASSAQTALAQALALSLTSEAIYLPKDDRKKLLDCAKSHSSVALGIQQVFLDAYQESREQLNQKKLKVSKFNERREKFFQPWIDGILEFEGTSIDPGWFREVAQRGLVKDEDIENKFPRLVLGLLNAHETSAKKTVIPGGVEMIMENSIVNFNVLWNLSDNFIPVMSEWAKRHDEEQKTSE